MRKTTSQSYIVMMCSVFVATTEHPKRYSWWLNELCSLGINTHDKDGLENRKEACNLTEAVRLTLYQDYLQAYSGSNQ